MHVDQDVKSRFLIGFLGFLVDFDGNCFLTLKDYSTLSYQKLSLIIDYTLLSEAKEIWYF